MRFGYLFATVPLAALTLVSVTPVPAEGCCWKRGWGRAYYSPVPPVYYYYAPEVRPMPAVPGKPTAIVTVGARDSVFEPPTSNVQPGTTLHWMNNGKHVHKVTSDDSKWDSGDLAPGATHSVTFVTPGTYRYHCKHHKGMVATIVVGK